MWNGGLLLGNLPIDCGLGLYAYATAASSYPAWNIRDVGNTTTKSDSEYKMVDIENAFGPVSLLHGDSPFPGSFVALSFSDG